MTNMGTAAEKVAEKTGEREKDKEKTGIRRALGRGLESLLPGPRVVGANTGAEAGKSPPFAKSAKDGAPGGAPGQAMDSASEQQVPRFARSDSPLSDDKRPSDDKSPGEGVRLEGVIHAVVDDEAEGASPSLRSETAELRSAGQPGAAVPTYSSMGDALLRSAERTNASAPTQSASAQSFPTQEEGITLMASVETGQMPANLVVNLPIEQIDKNPFQTRYVEDDDALEELAESIKANGVVQPIMVRPAQEDGRYILILGERRLHASKKAGKETIPALIRRVSDQQAAEMTIIENLQREDLSPLEQAQAFKVLSQEFKLTQVQIGERVGLSRESVANYMRLLKLPREVMQLLAEKRLTFAEAKELLTLEDNDQIQKAALIAVKKGMTIEQIERMVISMTGKLESLVEEQRKSSGARWVDPNVRAAQTDLERLLGVRVRIRDRKGKGRIVIEYATVDDYERVVSMLRRKDRGD